MLHSSTSSSNHTAPSASTFLWTLRISETETLWISKRRQPRKVSVAEVEARGQEWLCQVMQQVEKTLKWHSSLRVFVGMSCIALQPGWGEGWAVNLESYIPCNIITINMTAYTSAQCSLMYSKIYINAQHSLIYSKQYIKCLNIIYNMLYNKQHHHVFDIIYILFNPDSALLCDAGRHEIE